MAEIRKKSEVRKPKSKRQAASFLSGFGLLSDFGFQPSDLLIILLPNLIVAILASPGQI